MPKTFAVTLERHYTETIIVQVEAPSEKVALLKAGMVVGGRDWTVEECIARGIL